MGEAVPLGEITEQHFDATFGLNTRGTLFTVQKALPLFNDGGSIFMTGSVASVKGFPGYGVYAASKAALRSFARTWLNELKGRNIRVNVLSPALVQIAGAGKRPVLCCRDFKLGARHSTQQAQVDLGHPDVPVRIVPCGCDASIRSQR